MADGPGAIVGRAGELEAIERALSGGLRGMVLTGAAGVGKSRLAEAALDTARARGDTVITARASAVSRNVPMGAVAALVPPLGAEANPLAAAAAALVGHRRPGTRLVVSIDDAHWLDETSAAVIRHVLGAVDDVFVLLTVRSGVRSGDAVRLLWREPGVVRLAVATLGDAEIVALAEAHVGGRLDDNAAVEVSALAAGNPLAATELVLAGRAAGTLRRDGDVWQLAGDLTASPEIVDLVAERLERLGTGDRELFERVVFGEPLALDAFTPAELSALAALDEEGFVTVRIAGERQEVWVGHPLFGEVLRRTTPAIRRRAVLGQLVDRVRALEHDVDAVRVALWSLESGARVADDLLGRAAARAFAAHRFDLAALLMRAVPPARRTIEQAYQLVVATWWTGRAGWFDEAITEARTRAVLPGNERLGTQLDDFDSRRFAVALETPREFLAAVAAAGVTPTVGPDPRASAPMVYALSLSYTGRPVTAVEPAEKLLESHRAAWLEDPTAMFPRHPVTAVLAVVFARLLAGDLASARERAGLTVEYETGGDVAVIDAYAALSHGLVAQRAGELKRAQHWFARSAARYERSMHRGGPMPHLAHTLATIVAAQRADVEVARSHLPADDPLAAGLYHGLWMVADGWVAIAERDLLPAAERLQRALPYNLARGDVYFAFEAALALGRIGRVDLVAPHLDAFAPVEGPLLTGWRDSLRAVADGDADRLVALVDEFDALGALVEAAETAADAARWLTRHKRGREATAMALRARQLASRCEGLDTPSLAIPIDPVALTAREREIALLAADRVPAKEIAERLFISARTVTNHLQRVYEKLGVSSRRQLASALGLTVTNGV